MTSFFWRDCIILKEVSCVLFLVLKGIAMIIRGKIFMFFVLVHGSHLQQTYYKSIELLQQESSDLLIYFFKMKIPTKQIELIDSDRSYKKHPLLDEEEIGAKSEKGRRKSRAASDKFSAVSKQDEINDQPSNIVDGQLKPIKKKREKEKDKEKKFSWSIWRKLFQYTMQRKFLAILGLFLSICFAMSVSLLPLKVGKVLDQITVTSEEETQNDVLSLKQGVWELFILVACLAVFTYLRFISLQFLQQFLAMDMRNDFYRKFIENDMYFFQQYKSGELVSRLSSDVNQAKSAVSNNLTYMIRSVVIILSNIIILFTISWVLTLLVMILVPLYSIITLQYSKRNKVLVRQYQDVQAEISALVAQKFSGIQLIKAYSTEQKQIDNYGQIITKGYLINRKKLLLTGLYNSCSEFLPYLGILIVLWYGGKMVIEGKSELTAGELTSFIMYCTSLANSTSAISNCYTNIINGTYAVQKVFDMLDYKRLVDQSYGQKIKIQGEIEFKNVTFKYPTSKTIALNNLSLKINRGEYIAFVGESGSGKSTIIKLIQKFYKIESGGIFFGPHNQEDINAIYLRKQMGLVNQDATMFSGTIRDNITYGLDDYSIEDIQDAAERAGCMQFLKDQKRFPKKFDSSVGEKGGNLSGGQKQRISIARALMRKPKIIIFDEATSALDSNSEQMVQVSIQKLALNNRQDKPTIIVIAHRLSTVMNADRIFVMKSGQVVEVGSHKQLRALKGYYYQLIEKQLGDNPQLNMSPERPSVRIQKQ